MCLSLWVYYTFFFFQTLLWANCWALCLRVRNGFLSYITCCDSIPISALVRLPHILFHYILFYATLIFPCCPYQKFLATPGSSFLCCSMPRSSFPCCGFSVLLRPALLRFALSSLLAAPAFLLLPASPGAERRSDAVRNMSAGASFTIALLFTHYMPSNAFLLFPPFYSSLLLLA